MPMFKLENGRSPLYQGQVGGEGVGGQVGATAVKMKFYYDISIALLHTANRLKIRLITYGMNYQV